MSNENDFVAPCSAFHSWWQSKDLGQFFKYLNGLEERRAQKLVLSFVDLETELSQFLIRELNERNITAEFIVSGDRFLSDLTSVKSSLAEGVHFSIIISKPLEPNLLKKIEEFKQNLSPLKFIIVGRKDWNSLLTYRSIPFYMRSVLYFDCPCSLYFNDPFYLNSEREVFLEKIRSFFPKIKLKTYCPNIRCYAEWRHYSWSGQNPRDELSFFCTRSDVNTISWEKFGQEKISNKKMTPEENVEKVMAEKEEYLLQKRKETHYKQEQRKELYWNIYRSTPKVAIEGHVLQMKLFLHSIGVKLFWFTFKAAYPFRKIYYMAEFEYEKRVLGLHKKKKAK
jgi:hypothetical protein